MKGVNMLKRMFCSLFGHDVRVVRVMNSQAQKLHCDRCNRDYAIHFPTRSFVRWDKTFDEFYAEDGPYKTILRGEKK